MSRLAAITCLALLLAGCGFGRDEELQSLVEDIAPADKKMAGCEWQKNWGSAEVEAYYSCSWLVRGTIARVGRPIVSRAVARGFTVWCDGKEGLFEVAGASGKKALAVEIVAPEAGRPQTISNSGQIPPGHVMVSIAAAKLESGAPQGPARFRCVA